MKICIKHPSHVQASTTFPTSTIIRANHMRRLGMSLVPKSNVSSMSNAMYKQNMTANTPQSHPFVCALHRMNSTGQSFAYTATLN